jgi:hypothetical protein
MTDRTLQLETLAAPRAQLLLPLTGRVRSLLVTSVHIRFFRDDLEKISTTGREGVSTLLHLSNNTSFANVLTPPSVHHLMLVC